jgi:predicted PilT family ATPase
MLCAGYEACVGKMRNSYNILATKPMERENLEDVGVDRKIIMKRILRKQSGKMVTGFT